MGAALLTEEITDNNYGNYNTRGQPMQVQDMLHHSTTQKHCDYVCQDSVKLTNLSDSDTRSELIIEFLGCYASLEFIYRFGLFWFFSS